MGDIGIFLVGLVVGMAFTWLNVYVLARRRVRGLIDPESPIGRMVKSVEDIQIAIGKAFTTPRKGSSARKEER